MSRHRFALAFLAAVALPLFLMPLLRGEVFTLRDHFDYFQPLRWFTAQELQAGRLPLWNPWNASGEPWLANPQTGVFYPPSWLFLLLPFATAYMLFLLVHLVVLGWGACLLFRRTVSEGAALVGAAALMFSGPVLSLLDVSNNLATLAWIPLALWCAAEGAWRRGGIVLTLAFLGGEPFFAALAGVLVLVASFAGRAAPAAPQVAEEENRGGTGRGGRAARGRIRGIVLTALVAFGLSAVQLFPFLEMVGRSDRAAGLHEETILAHSMAWRDWLRIAVPPALDDTAIDPNLTQHFIPVVYVGMLVCALALLGIRRRTLPWLALLAFAVLVSLGPPLLARLPLTLFRYPARLVPFGALAIAALAAAGWDRIRPNRRWVDLVVVFLVLVDLMPRAWPLLQTAPFRVDAVPYPHAMGLETKVLRVGAIDPAHRAAWMSGYLNLYDRRFDFFTAAPVISNAYARMHDRILEKPTREELGRKGIGWILTTRSLGLRAAYRAGDVIAYRNNATMPTAFEVVRNPTTPVPARVVFDTSRARVTVDAAREGVVVLLQQDAPGWRVSIDGVEAKNIRIDGLFRGVQVTRGRHEIVWSYRPLSLLLGAATTLLTLLALTLLRFVKRAR